MRNASATAVPRDHASSHSLLRPRVVSTASARGEGTCAELVVRRNIMPADVYVGEIRNLEYRR